LCIRKIKNGKGLIPSRFFVGAYPKPVLNIAQKTHVE